MEKTQRVFKDVTDFVDTIPQMLDGRAKTNVLMVALDVISEQGTPTPLSFKECDTGSARLSLATLVGDYVIAGMDLLSMVPAGELGSQPKEGPHPVDVFCEKFAFPPDAVAVVYADEQEWRSSLATVKKLLERFSSGKVFVVACTCARERKLEAIKTWGVAVDGVVFTEECGGSASMEMISALFMLAAHE